MNTVCTSGYHEDRGLYSFCPHCGQNLKRPNSSLSIYLIVDRSGSMGPCHSATVEGINRFVRDQRDKAPDDLLTVLQFDDLVETVISSIPLRSAGTFTLEHFKPRGMTALLDALGQTLSDINPQRGSKGIICIVTDGEENSSRMYSRERVTQLTRDLESRGWTFIYLGANQDSFKIGNSLGFNLQANYAPTHFGTQYAYGAISNATTLLRSGGQTALNKQWGQVSSSINDQARTEAVEKNYSGDKSSTS